MREGVRNNLSTRFPLIATDLVNFYQDLRDHHRKPCTFPETWDADYEFDEDSCKAIDQIVTRISKWGRVFVRHCRREEKGRDPWNIYDRQIAKVNVVAERAKLKMSCRSK